MLNEELGELRRLLSKFSDEHPGNFAVYSIIDEVDSEIEIKERERK